MPRRLLIVILLARPRSCPTGASFWQNALNAVPPPTPLEPGADGTPPAVKRYGMIPVFRTLYTPQAIPSSSTQPIGRDQRDQEGRDYELFGLFFEASLLEAVDVGEFLKCLVEKLGGKTGDSDGDARVDCRAYQPYSVSDTTPGGLVPTEGGTLVFNSMTPSEESEVLFNRWYTEEHLPMLRAVPGWRSSRRFVLIDSRHMPYGEPLSAPKYLALHKWEDDGFFGTKEYKAATNTPWRTEVISAVQEKQRLVQEYLGWLEESGNWG